MVGWHHQLNGHEFEQTLGDREVQGSLACCSPLGRTTSGTTEWLNNNNNLSHNGCFSHGLKQIMWPSAGSMWEGITQVWTTGNVSHSGLYHRGNVP